MTHRLIVKVIVENVVTCFLGHGVVYLLPYSLIIQNLGIYMYMG